MKLLAVMLVGAGCFAQSQSFYQLRIVPQGASPGAIVFVDPISRHTATMGAPTNLLSDVVFRAPVNIGKLGNPLTSDGNGGTTFASTLNLDSLNVADSVSVANSISVENLLRVTNDIQLNGNFRGKHAQNVGTSDSPVFYVPTVSKLALRDYLGLGGTLSFSLSARINLGFFGTKQLDVLDLSGNSLFSFADQATVTPGSRRNTSLAELYVGSVGTPLALTVSGLTTASGGVKIGSTTVLDSSANATVHDLHVTGTTSGITCTASTSTSTSPAFCTNSTCSSTATIDYVSGVSVACP